MRQLSFYNFRRTGAERRAKLAAQGGGAAAAAAAAGPTPIMEFTNDRFTRDNPERSLAIKRKTYGVDEVKEEVLEVKADIKAMQVELKELRNNVNELGTQFDEMRRAMLQVLRNQQHLHTTQQQQQTQVATTPSGTGVPLSLIHI